MLYLVWSPNLDCQLFYMRQDVRPAIGIAVKALLAKKLRILQVRGYGTFTWLWISFTRMDTSSLSLTNIPIA